MRVPDEIDFQRARNLTDVAGMNLLLKLRVWLGWRLIGRDRFRVMVDGLLRAGHRLPRDYYDGKGE